MLIHDNLQTILPMFLAHSVEDFVWQNIALSQTTDTCKKSSVFKQQKIQHMELISTSL